MTTKYSAELLVPAEPAAVWDVLTDPARHPSIDASESVVGPVTAGRIATVGQVFTISVLTVAAAEAAIGIAILVCFFRNTGTIAVEDINVMKG